MHYLACLLGLLLSWTSWTLPVAAQGSWEGPLAWPLAPTHAALLSDGRVLFWSDTTPDPQIWDPVSGNFSATGNENVSAATAVLQLPNGEVGIAGGTALGGFGASTAQRYTVSTNTWSSMPSLISGRLGPAALSLATGRLLVLAGEEQPGQPAEYPETAGIDSIWSELISAQFTFQTSPWSYSLSNGDVLAIDASQTSRRLIMDANPHWATLGNLIDNGRTGGTSVGLPGYDDRFLVTGGRDPGISSAEILSLNVSNFWQSTASMNFSRRHHNATLLADGTVLVTGGTFVDDNPDFAVLQPELFDPILETWTPMDSAATARGAGSIALLLPDARVLLAGGTADAEIFSPPYLAAGSRPVIESAPQVVTYGNTFLVDSPDAENIQDVWAVRAGAVAGGFNSGQRALPLAFTTSPGVLSVSAPDSAGSAPPGTYMLFVVEDSGVPSEAAMLQLTFGELVITPPAITTTPPTTAQVGINYVYQAQASGDEPFTWSIVQGPAWIGVNSFNGIVTGAPDAEGMYNVTLRAENAGGFDEQMWTIDVAPGGGGTQTVIPLGATWRYFKGENDPGSNWADLGYDDSAWLQGPSGFGFGDGDDATVLSDMRYNYSTVFTRYEFNVTSAASVTMLSILYDYDDGFAVFLNGTRIYSLRAPSTITHTSTATGSHEANDNLSREDITDAGTLSLLAEGNNVLAAVGLNRSLSSSDCTLKIEFEITGGSTTPTGVEPGRHETFAIQYPNPSRSTTTFRVRAPAPGQVGLDLYDVAGRRLRRLRAEVLAGTNPLHWDGRDDAGRHLAPGIYFYRLHGTWGEKRGRLVRLAPVVK